MKQILDRLLSKFTKPKPVTISRNVKSLYWDIRPPGTMANLNAYINTLQQSGFEEVSVMAGGSTSPDPFGRWSPNQINEFAEALQAAAIRISVCIWARPTRAWINSFDASLTELARVANRPNLWSLELDMESNWSTEALHDFVSLDEASQALRVVLNRHRSLFKSSFPIGATVHLGRLNIASVRLLGLDYLVLQCYATRDRSNLVNFRPKTIAKHARSLFRDANLPYLDYRIAHALYDVTNDDIKVAFDSSVKEGFTHHRFWSAKRLVVSSGLSSTVRLLN